MGLDIVHFQANKDKRGTAIALEPVPSAQLMDAKFPQWLETIEQEIIDWDRAFASLGMSNADYAPGPSTRSISHPSKSPVEHFTFVKRSSVRLTPEVVVFTNQRVSLLGRLFGREDSALRHAISMTGTSKAQAVHRLDFPTTKLARSGIYADRIGYQRKSVCDQFYSEFAPVEYVTDLKRVRRIFELTAEPQKQHFQREFLDNWSDEASFLFVWW
jgi:hypothetical protein